MSASRDNCIGLVPFCSIILVHWFENRTHSTIGVRFCSIAEPNRTIGVRLGSIGFLFGFVRLHRSGRRTRIEKNAFLNQHVLVWKRPRAFAFISYLMSDLPLHGQL